MSNFVQTDSPVHLVHDSKSYTPSDRRTGHLRLVISNETAVVSPQKRLALNGFSTVGAFPGGGLSASKGKALDIDFWDQRHR